jgi:transcriptional regulator with XRE-family HTH domain
MVNSDIIVDEQRTKEIGQRIKECRKRTLISLQEMADYIGIGYEQYRRIEAGTVLIKTDYLIPLAVRLNASADYLLYGMTQNPISHRELASLINELSPEEIIKAKKVLIAIFG